MCAALAARENGAEVLVLESASEADRGGNTRYAAGQMRVGFGAAKNLMQVVEGLDAEALAHVDIEDYGPAEFFDDVARLTQYRTNADLMDVVVGRSLDTLAWMRSQGVRFQLSFGRQAHREGKRFRFWGNLPCEAWGGGVGMLEAYYKQAARTGITMLYGVAARRLVTSGDRVCGIEVADRGEVRRIDAGAVVLACGGFESNADMRAMYLGPNWDLAKVRGTRFNTGRGLKMALDIGAAACGQMSGAHSTCWDLNAPESGDLIVGDSYQKHSYPFGIMVNARGERFLDEGADFRNYTYAKYGAELLHQPGMFAWQIFDGRAIAMLRDEYRVRQVTKARADTLEALAEKLEGVDAKRFLEMIGEFNRAVPAVDGPINAGVKDGRSTHGLAVPKSNWAYPIDEPPFEAYAVTTGITFTFGGLKIDTQARVQSTLGQSIGGLCAAGEIVGSLFYHNYPGGSGLTAGAVFGRIAGQSAAQHARSAR
ncbi:MAG: Tricarballylate dehydrogenase [Betaproteobacteria bacterium]|nr:Tricarballylate dehydrogenase [Betaproteobacteria bacterium]